MHGRPSPETFRMLTPTNLIIASVAFALTGGAARTLAGTSTGPSSSASPYVINVPDIVDIDEKLGERGRLSEVP